MLNDAEYLGQPMPARAWGVEHLSPLDRVEMVLEAGYDQSGGGEACTELVVELVRAGRVGEDRIDVPFDTADPLFGSAKGLASAARPLGHRWPGHRR